MNINNLLGPILMAVGAYFGYFGLTTEGDVSMTIWAKALAGLGIGGGVTAYNSFPYLKGLFTSLQSKQNSVLSSSIDEPVAGISIKVEEDKDGACLYYLTERLKDSPEGLELCRKLNDLIFTLHHKKDVEVKNG